MTGARQWAAVAAVAALLACGLVVGACSTGAPATSDEPVQTGVRTVSVDAADVVVPPIEMASLKNRNCGQLVGPHYSLGIAWMASGPVLDEDDAAKLEVPAVQAPQGEQLTVMAIDPAVISAAFKPTDPVVVDALINGKATQLPGTTTTAGNHAQQAVANSVEPSPSAHTRHQHDATNTTI